MFIGMIKDASGGSDVRSISFKHPLKASRRISRECRCRPAYEFRYDRDVERAHGLPAATGQVKFVKPDGMKGFRDRCYEEYGLIVELDGEEFHPAGQRGQDRARDNEAAATTGATLRYGWADVDRTPCDTAGQLYRALRKRGYEGSIRPCSAACRALLAA